MKNVKIEIIGKNSFKLLEHRCYTTKYGKFHVRKNYITDMASTPHILWSILPPVDARYASAVVIHDYLCNNHKVSRYIADKIMYDEIRRTGGSLLLAFSMFIGVRVYAILANKK